MRPAAQMYTLRDHTKSPAALDAALGKVAAIGYPAVQLSAVGAWDEGGIDAAGLRDMLDRHGLVCCATHRPLARLLLRRQRNLFRCHGSPCYQYCPLEIASDFPKWTKMPQ